MISDTVAVYGATDWVLSPQVIFNSSLLVVKYKSEEKKFMESKEKVTWNAKG